MRTASIILTLLLVLCSPAQAQGPQQQKSQQRTTTKRRSLTSSEIAKRALRSVVEIVSKDSDGRPIASGSGFFVDGRPWEWLIATNYHVVKDAASIAVRIVGDSIEFSFRWEIGWIDEKNDLALLNLPEIPEPPSPPREVEVITIDDIRAFVRPPLPLGNSNSVKVGDEVFAVGNPQGYEGTFSQGIVSALRGKDLIQITSPISEGSSGGPVLNKRGEVIGVVVMIARDGQNLNFAIPAVYLKSLLNKARTTTHPKISSDRTPSLAANTKTPSTRGSRELSDEYSRQASEYFDAGLYDKVIEACKLRTKIDPEGGYSCLGYYYSVLGLHRESLDAYKEFIRINPDLGFIHFRMGNEYFELGQYKEAIEAHEVGLHVYQEFADSSLVYDGYIGLGLAHSKLGNFFTAYNFFKRASRVSPDHWGVGDAYAKLGDFHSAIKAYKEAIQSKPDDFRYRLLGDAYTEAGLYREAIEAYGQALRIDPNKGLIYYQLGLTYLKLGNKGLVLEQYKSLKKLAETQPKLKALANELFDLIYK